MPFWIFGGIGLAWAVVLALFLRDTKPASAHAQDGTAVPSAAKPRISEACAAVFSKPTALCVALGLAMMIYVDIGFKNWMPSHLQGSFLDSCPFLK